MSIEIVRLVMTCSACPEQYDAFIGDKKIGYLRLRHGHFTVEYPDCGDEMVYTASPDGDGIFNNDERDYYLRFAVDALQRRHRGDTSKAAAPDVSYEVVGGHNED